MLESDAGFVLRRSILFVPGDDRKKIERARNSAADTLILDLEDAIPPEGKDEARQCVREELQRGVEGNQEVAVRINPPGTPFFEADVELLRTNPGTTCMVPKSERVAAIASLAGELAKETALLLLIETPRGVADALAIGEAAPTIEALCFGHADFSLEMGLRGAEVTNPAVHHARANLAISARANRLAPIDCVYLDVRDDEGFRHDTQLGLSLGYEGRLCIHPRQVELANEIYTPTPDQLEYAKRVVEAFDQAEGSGVITVDGKMIDAPVVSQQRGVLARAAKL